MLANGSKAGADLAEAVAGFGTERGADAETTIGVDTTIGSAGGAAGSGGGATGNPFGSGCAYPAGELITGPDAAEGAGTTGAAPSAAKGS